MQLVDSFKSNVEDVYKLVFRDSKNSILEVSYLRKNDGKDILVVPTQTSCNMGCVFCHLTGLDVPADNLIDEDIIKLVDESLTFQTPANPTLLVSYMGAGEPLLNVRGIIESAKKLSQIKAYQKVRFAVSTLIPGKKPFLEFTKEVIKNQLDFKLHWSLHSVKQNSRKSLMPSALNIQESAELVRFYQNKTGNPVEVHYTLIEGVNDSKKDAEEVSKLIDKRTTVKLLRFAPHVLAPSLVESNCVVDFKNNLENLGCQVEVYSPPGRDVNASCGMFVLDQYTN